MTSAAGALASAPLTLERLAELAIHTVRVCFVDHFGALRGRRVTADRYVDAPEGPQGFCDGALVWDTRCEIFDETPFSNFDTGYPDVYLHPDLATLRPCGWAPGDALVLGTCHDSHGVAVGVDPRRALAHTLERTRMTPTVAAELEWRLQDASWLPGCAPPAVQRAFDGLRHSGLPVVAARPVGTDGRVRLTLAGLPPVHCADALAVARTAVRELDGGASFLPRLRSDQSPARLRFVVAEPVLDAHATARRLEDAMVLLRPTPVGYAAPAAASVWVTGHAIVVDAATAEANPHLALAVVLAALAEREPLAPLPPPVSHEQAAERLAGADWLGRWLPEELLVNGLAIARREAALRAAALSSWDLDRYGPYL